MKDLITEKEVQRVFFIYIAFVFICLLFNMYYLPGYFRHIIDNFSFYLIDVGQTFGVWCLLYTIFKAIYFYILKPLKDKITGK